MKISSPAIHKLWIRVDVSTPGGIRTAILDGSVVNIATGIVVDDAVAQRGRPIHTAPKTRAVIGNYAVDDRAAADPAAAVTCPVVPDQAIGHGGTVCGPTVVVGKIAREPAVVHSAIDGASAMSARAVGGVS